MNRSECVQQGWFLGLTCDHLYGDCPNRKRGEKELRRAEWWEPATTHIDPHGGDVCGLCLYRHNRKHHKAGAQ